MIILQSVQLNNFRGVQAATFTPLTGGLTGISGPNGSGKSSFLEGAVWALFGVTPEGTSQAQLRRDGGNYRRGHDTSFVEVVFLHSGQTITVRRELTGPSATAELATWIDGEEHTHTSIKVGQKWIEERLGIDAHGFMTAFVVRQKELDDLIKSGPAARRATIERLAGIDKLSAALKTAREEYNKTKTLASHTTITEEDVEKAQRELDAHTTHTINLSDRAAEAVEKYENFKTEVFDSLLKTERELNQKMILARQYRDDLEQKKGQVSTLKTLIETEHHKYLVHIQKHQLPDERSEIETLDEAHSKELTHHQTALQELKTSRQIIETRLQEIRATQISASNKKTKTESLIAVSEKSIADSEMRLKNNLQPTLSENIDLLAGMPSSDTLQREIDSSTQKRADLLEQFTKERTIQEQTQESLKVFLNATVESTCPTCQTPISSSQQVINTLESIITDQQNKMDKIKTEGEKVAALIERGKTALEKERSLTATIQALKESIFDTENVIASEKKKIDTLKEQLANDVSVLNSISDELHQEENSARELEEKETEIRSQIRVVEGKLETTQSALLLLDAYQSVQKNHATAESEAHDLQQKMSTLSVPTEDEYATARNALDEAGDTLRNLEDKRSETINLRDVAQEKQRSLQRELQHQQSEYEKKKQLLRAVAETSGAVSVIDEFRRAQIARIAPELSETATTLVNKMTNGYFNEVTLDENFTPTITLADGSERPISWLSGGEVSVVALALRIAIGDLVTGGTGGLLWLDEVLTAQDANRRASLINTIRSLTERQMVLINHTQEATDIVDKTVTLTQTETGTIITEEQ